jgi:hypothetical protein
MKIRITDTAELCNTQYAPLVALSALYQQTHRLEALEQVHIPMKIRTYTSADKLNQVLLSILAGCVTLSEVNNKLGSEGYLANLWGWSHFADQSSLSRTLDELTLKQIDQLRQSTQAIWSAHSQVTAHDWRQYLWLDYDLSGLPCSSRAEESQKGFFSDKKTLPEGSWRASVPSNTGKRSGLMCFRGTGIPHTVFNQRSRQPKEL